MKISKNALQAKINNLSKELHVSANVLLASFFFDAFIVRISRSDYAENFVFKGGFYLATLLGVQNRYTVDIDFLLTQQNLEEENIRHIIEKIISVPSDDGIAFDFNSIEAIRDADEYGGFSVSLTGHFENIRQVIHIDIATGDPITPSAVDYCYKRLLSDETVNFKAYNLETVLAEKMQTILSRGVLNSRSKDFYDIYIIHKLRWEQIDTEQLKRAFQRTAEYRNTPFEKETATAILNEIEQSDTMENRWKNYARKSSFAKNVVFTDVMDSCHKVLDEIFF